MSLLNGLSEAGRSLANLGGALAVQSMQNSWEQERMRLASEYAEGRESRARAETQAFTRSEREAKQDFERPGEDARIRASNAQAGLAETSAANAKSAEARLQSGIDAAGGKSGGGSLSDEQRQFVEKVRPWAEAASQKTGVDAKIIIAQAALETGWGKSAPGNNYLGVKSHGQSGGQTLETTEVVDGKPVKVKDSFRTYNSPAESFDDYAKFVPGQSRYNEMRNAKGLDAQIEALGRSGYATDPQYAAKIGSIVRTLGDGTTAAPGSALPASIQAKIDGLVSQGRLKEAGDLETQWAAEKKPRDNWAPLSEEAGKRLLGAGFDPNKAYQINTANGEIKPIGGAMVHVDQRGESTALKTQIEAASKGHAELQDGAKAARAGLAQVERLSDLMKQLNTGKFTASALEVKRIAQSFGIDLGEKEIGAAEAADALSKQLALQMRNPASGAGMPGAMSDADREFLMRTIPTLGTTPEGRAQMVQTARSMFQRTIDQAKIANDYVRSKEFATDPAGLYAKLQEFADKNPMFAQGGEGGSKAPPPDAAPITATNPATGQKIMLQNGQWVPVR